MKFSANLFNKIVSLVLSVCIVVAYMPIVEANADSSVYGNDIIETTPMPDIIENNNSENVTEPEEENLDEVYVLNEDTSLRNEVTKYFEMSDGTMKACIYPQAVHYLEDGEYKEIDNSLELVTAGSKEFLSTEVVYEEPEVEDTTIENNVSSNGEILSDINETSNELVETEELIIEDDKESEIIISGNNILTETVDDLDVIDEPELTDNSIISDSIIMSENETITEQSLISETPTVSEIPLVLETPIVTETPTDTPIDTEITDSNIELIEEIDDIETMNIVDSGNLYERKDNLSKERVGRKGSFYKNKNNSFTVKIPEEYGTDYTEFSDENGFVSFKLVNTNKKSFEKENKKSFGEHDKTVVKDINDHGSYKDVRDNVDLEYAVSGNVLKETIILNEKTKEDFTFDVRTSAHSALLNEDGSITFYDENDTEIYVISAPYMFDSKGEYSSDITVDFKTTDKGYLLTYMPDEEWLYDTARVYPVKIDPTMFKALGATNVKDTYVASFQSSATPEIKGNTNVLVVGRRRSETNHIMRSLIKFDLPASINKNDCIIDAKLYLTHDPELKDDETVDGIQVDLHALTGTFTESGTYGLNTVSYDSKIVDYSYVDKSRSYADTVFTYDIFDFTELANRWHLGLSTNNGVLLKFHDDDVTQSTDKEVYYISKDSVYFASVSKFVEITYRNAVGLEDYWTYANYSVGRAGTSHINVFNGNHVFVHNDVSNNTLLNSFTLSHVYNSSLQVSDAADSDIEMYGQGWRLSLVHRLLSAEIDGNSAVKYVYTDGDGTKHYLVQTADGSIVDEDGLGYTYSSPESGSSYTHKLETKDDTILYFDSAGYMTKIEDSNGNYIDLNFEVRTDGSKRLSSIKTKTGDEFNLGYDSSSRLDYIEDKADRTTYYYYDSNNRLISIDYPDGTYSTFTYSEKTLSSVTEPGECKIEYVSNETNGKILSLTNYNSDYGVGGTNTFEYDYCQTKITDSDGYKLTYQFDTTGRSTCIYDSEENVCSYTYTEESTDSDGIFANNKASIESKGTIYTENLLKNPVFANGITNWWFNTIDGTLDTSNILLSSNSVKIVSSTITNNLAVQNISNATEGTYTLSAYLKGTVTDGTGGIGVRIITNNGNIAVSDYITSISDLTTDNGFVKLETTITLEEGDSINRVEAGLINSSGTVYIDSVQLEKEDTSGPVNLIENSSFETQGSGATIANKFTNSSTSYVSRSASAKYNGTYGLKIAGHASGDENSYQQISLSGNKGDAFSFGCWAFANSVQAHDDANPFAMKLTFKKNDTVTEEKYINFNTAVNDWQFAKDTIITSYDYDSIKVSFEYNNNENYAYFDCAFLYKDIAGSYRYDNNGNVISTTDFAKQQSEYQYSGNNLSKLVEPVGTGFEYYYDGLNNLIGSKSSEGIQNLYKYDANGNVKKVRIKADDNYAAVQTNETYYIRLKGSGKYLTADGTINSSNVSQQSFTGENNQKWMLKQTDDGYYTIHPQNSSGKCIDIAGGSDYEGASVVIYTKYTSGTGANQKFKLEPNYDYTYRIVPQSSSTGKKLTVKTYATASDVCLSSGDASDGYCWYFEKADATPVTSVQSGKVYRIRAYHSGRYVDVKNGSNVTGTSLIQCQLNHGENQYFYIAKNSGTDYYLIRPIYTNKYISISEDYSSTHTDSKYLFLNNTAIIDNNLFKLEYDTDGNKGFQIIPKSDTTKTLAVADSSLVNNAELIFTTKGTAENSYFILEECSPEMVSEASYTSDGEYISSITDSLGGETEYAYDESTDLLEGVMDPKGNLTVYSYNSDNDRLWRINSDDSTVSFLYNTNGSINKIISPSNTLYTLAYDSFGRTSSTLVGTTALGRYTYENTYSPLVSRFNYENGAYITYEYDSLNRLTKSTKSDSGYTSVSKTYKYDKLGKVAEIKDYNLTTKYNYDLSGRVTSLRDTDGYSLNNVYDEYNRVISQSYTSKNDTIKTTFTYGNNLSAPKKTGLIYGISYSDRGSITYQYDELNRKKIRSFFDDGLNVITRYKYRDGNDINTTTSLVSEEAVYTSSDLKYVNHYYYDINGNIIRIDEDYETIRSYAYDGLGQLTDSDINSTLYHYNYDSGGNILSVLKNGTEIKSYTYGDSNWKDLLTAYNGETITYDSIGNPLQYRDGMLFDWCFGRSLASVEYGDEYIVYSYDSDGYRKSKLQDFTFTSFKYINGVLMSEKTGTEEMVYLYDENGVISGVSIINGTTTTNYYYIVNIMGDVTGITDKYGTIVAQYTYDDWGNVLSITGSDATGIGAKNPIRYRGYYFDAETGFYYLGSRYYDPEIGRFLNADGYISTGTGILGYNMFVYCNNNSIMGVDINGYKYAIWADCCGSTKSNNNTPKDTKKSYSSAEATLEEVYNVSNGTSDWSPIVVETGETVSTVVAQQGSSSGIITFYASGVTNEPVSSTAGVKINLSDVLFVSSLGLDDMGFTYSVMSENQSTNTSVNINLKDLEICYEVSNSKYVGNTTTTTYTKVGVSAKLVATAYMVAVVLANGASFNSLEPAFSGG